MSWEDGKLCPEWQDGSVRQPQYGSDPCAMPKMCLDKGWTAAQRRKSGGKCRGLFQRDFERDVVFRYELRIWTEHSEGRVKKRPGRGIQPVSPRRRFDYRNILCRTSLHRETNYRSRRVGG